MPEENFKNVAAAGRWLRDQKYKVSRSKVHADAKHGLLRTQPDGTVSRADAESYVVRANLKRDGGLNPEQTEAITARRADAELEKIRQQTKSIVFDREIKEGKYILRDEAIAQRVDQLTVVETHFRQVLHTRMLQWCYTLAGNPDKVPDAVRQADIDLDGMLNALARSESFSIEYETEGAPDTAVPCVGE